MLKLNSLSKMSDIRLKSDFQVGREGFYHKNANKVMTPSQSRAEYVKSREWSFITPSHQKYRAELFTKDSISKMQVKAMKKAASFKNELVLTTKI